MSDFIDVLDGRYELIARIGAGGFSEVWSGRDQLLDRPVAVKLLHIGFTADTEILERFRAEARHAGLVSHENVARIYDYCGPASRHPPYLVMELVEGESLARELERSGPIDAKRTLEVIAQAAAGLQAAHEAGLIHRDIKPGNLLLDESGTVKVTDFGISQAVGSAPLTGTGLIVGSPGYLAPERADGTRATAASDLYSLGIVAYECLSGTRPFTGTLLEIALAHCERPIPPLPASVPPELALLVGELTAKDPAARPASAAEVASRAIDLRRRLAVPGQTGLVPQPAPAAVAAPAGVAATAAAAAPTRVAAPTAVAVPTAVVARWPRAGKRLAIGLGACACTLLASVFALSLLGAASQRAAGGAAGTNGQSIHAARVYVDRRALLGEPIGVARAQLERHHLAVLVRWRVTAAAPPGRVVAADPAGKLPADTLVTLTAAQAPPPPSHRPHDHHGGPPGKRSWLSWPPGHHHGDGPPGQGDPPGHHGDNG